MENNSMSVNESKMHIAVNSLFYLFRGEHQLVNTKNPKNIPSIVYFLNMIDNIKRSVGETDYNAISDAYMVKTKIEYDAYSEEDTKWQQYDPSLKKLSPILTGKKKGKCSRGEFVRFVNQNNKKNADLLETFVKEYYENPKKKIDKVKFFCDKVIGNPEKEKEAYLNIGRVILELIDKDCNIKDEHILFVRPDFQGISKGELRKRIYSKKNAMDFYSLLLGAMYLVFEIDGQEESGFETIQEWNNAGKIIPGKEYSNVVFEFQIPNDNTKDERGIKRSIQEYNDRIKKYYKNKKIEMCGMSQDFVSFYISNDLSYIEKTDNDNRKVTIQDASSYEKLMFLQNRSKFSIITGDAGIGKTTMLRSMLYEAVNDSAFNVNNILNVLVPLNVFETSIGLEKYIGDVARAVDERITQPLIKTLLKNGQIRIFFDAFDEIPKTKQREAIETILDFVTEYSDCFYILSSRNIENLRILINGGIGCEHYMVLPFSYKQTEQFVDNWAISSESKNDLNGDEMKHQFLKEARANGRLSDFLKNPLLLSILFATFIDNQQIFESRARLYKAIVDCLYRRQRIKLYPVGGFNSSLSKKELLDVFSEVAALCWYDDVLGFSENKIKNYFCQVLYDNSIIEDAYDVIADFSKELGLLVKEGGYYSFLHASFRDYFAARYFCSKKCTDKWAVDELLDKSCESSNIADFMIEIDKSASEMLVKKKLDYIFENWSEVNDNWDSFKKYMKSAYDTYKLFNEDRVHYYEGYGQYEYVANCNYFKTPIITMMHRFLEQEVSPPPEDHRFDYGLDDVNELYYECDYRLCNIMAKKLLSYEDLSSVSGCIKTYYLQNVKPEYYEIVRYEHEYFDEDGEFIQSGYKYLDREKVPTDGCEIEIKAGMLSQLDRGNSKKDKELKQEIKSILQDKNISGPFYDFERLKVLRNILNKKMLENDFEVRFGLRNNEDEL